MKRASATAVALLSCACASAPAWKHAPHDRPYQSVPPAVLVPCPPTSDDPSEWWLALSRGAIEPLARAVSPSTLLHRPEALDVNAFGQVVGSSWFEPRLGAHTMTSTDVVIGHARTPPAPGVLRVLGAKLEGVTPGLVVEDVAGHRFVVKFDPPALPGMSSGAELIASRVLHAAGWHVPENYLGELRLDALTLDPSATTRGQYGREIPLTREGLSALVSNVNPTRHGAVRALFSRVLPGRALGHDSFRGTRPYTGGLPPTSRRSLRGLGLFFAWLNNTDARDSNTLATWVPAPGQPEQGTITHHLLDFGDSLGAAGARAKFQSEGYEYRVDWVGIGGQLFSLGLYYHRWLPVRRAPMRAVGFFESEVFDPADWRPGLPNPSFDAATALDRYWAASVLARFTPEMVAAIVRAARYGEPGAEAHVVQTLRERQEKLLRWAFEPVLPLDDPRIEGEGTLRLRDLAVDAGVLDQRRITWTAWWARAPRAAVAIGAGELADAREIVLPLAPLVTRAKAEHGAAFEEDPFLTVRLVDVERPDVGVDVHLRVVGSQLLPVGLDRDVD